ncbi:MAG: sortase [Lachnospiraceae bacterium]|nr:sortase [Lachnospiraceae bacterium]
MKRRIGIGLMITGTVLLLTALSLTLFQLWEEMKAGEAVSEALVQVKSAVVTQEEISSETDNSIGMTVVEIDGWDYIGYLSVPALGLELPVMAEWSYEGLEIAPGRYYGSVCTNDLVIAGHNYRQHFSALKTVLVGTIVIFTDMDGNSYYYEVIRLDTLEPDQIDEMEGLTGDDDWDLTLFTCTTGGRARRAIRCVRTE